MTNREVFVVTPTASMLFLVALGRTIRRCETAPGSSRGIRELLQAEIRDVLTQLPRQDEDRASLEALRSKLDELIDSVPMG